MGHRLPAAGVPTSLSEHFRCYQVTPRETRCTRETRTLPGDCTLRPKFIARTVLRPVPDPRCCSDREKAFACCEKTQQAAIDSDRRHCARQGEELRCLEFRPVGGQRQDLCRLKRGQGTSMCVNTSCESKRKPYVIWKREPYCRHFGSTDCDVMREGSRKIQNNEGQGSHAMNACMAQCQEYCEKQVMSCPPVNKDPFCCSPREKITLLCPVVPVVKVDSRPGVPYYGKKNPNYRFSAQTCERVDAPKIFCTMQP